MFNYKDTPYHEKIYDLLSHYKTSTALAHALEVTRMTLTSWGDSSDSSGKIRDKNKEKIDFLWCKQIFLPNLTSSDYFNNIDHAKDPIRGISIKALLKEPGVLSKVIKKTTFGSLEIETGTSKKDFDTIIEKQIPPHGSSIKSILETQNIWTLNSQIVNNHIAKVKQEISINQIRRWHTILMSGVLNNAGNFSKNIRVIPGTDLTLTHPDDIEEELSYWLQKHQNPKTLIDIVVAHNHFELIHPFSDGNGRIGRSIVLAQCLKLDIMPPLINSKNKEMYYALLEHSQKKGIHQPLALFFKDTSGELEKILDKHKTKRKIRDIYPTM